MASSRSHRATRSLALGLVFVALALAGCETSKARSLTKLEAGAGEITFPPGDGPLAGATFTAKDGIEIYIYGICRGTVIGGGETSTLAVGACGKLDRNTKGTGITPEGRAAIREAVAAGFCISTGGAGCLAAGLLRGDDPDPDPGIQ